MEPIGHGTAILRRFPDSYKGMLKRDVNILMFPFGGLQKKNAGDDAAEVVQKGEMPLWFYTIPHPEAKLSLEEKTFFTEGRLATFGGESEQEHREEHEDEHKIEDHQ